VHVDGVTVGENDGRARTEADGVELGAVGGGDDARGAGQWLRIVDAKRLVHWVSVNENVVV
jgi:hypothetical protein